MLREYERIIEAKDIWIYGAGVYGRNAVKIFSQDFLEDKVTGVAVSRRENNPPKVGKYTVYELGDIHTPMETSLFIIAVSEEKREEIVNALCSAGYHNYIVWTEELIQSVFYLTHHLFEDRRRNLDKVCFVLCGYKEFLWDRVFERLERFVPADVEVCILSSGLISERLSAIAEKNEWSYLSSEINDITLIENMAVAMFPEAEWIFKMDEDIFLTKNCFEHLWEMYDTVVRKAPYQAGIVAPLIPVNGYGYIRILNRLGRLKQYENRFGRAFYGGNSESMIEKDVAAAEYMWGMTGEVPQIDELNDMVSHSDDYSVCSVRFSIGFIMFRRSLWLSMNGFTVTGTQDFGKDEIELCTYCMINSKAIIVAENVAVGHFSFGQQTEGMKELYADHPELFQIKEL